ncbi:CRISPR-associated helicase/endonuclease Cas3 [Bacillus wiedmannii]|uniref:CRISPR-associated helicase/endonuclease Cas3 n=1 Tax=Bacillus wiedmannii TaxID=1890302 RepID=UPI000BF17FC2|nr:CRISPR-associated helicase/endonuclease Cas3 [Bacillus wiedmannii]PEL82592.1 CRISPR-associated helicase/endonuclease Cas3 [Bacillus wiedmannii]
MEDFIYAKWDQQTGEFETLQEHTRRVLENLSLLKHSYGSLLSEEIWQLVQVAAQYHDAGKIYEGFQQIIKLNMGLSPLTKPEIEKKYPNVPHAFISLLCVPFLELHYSKSTERVVKEAIAHHHVRNVMFDAQILNAVLPDLKGKIDRLEQELCCSVNQNLDTTTIGWKPIKKKEKEYPLLVLVKGLLNRVDHAASAGELVEYHADKGVGTYVDDFLKKDGHKPRDLQLYSYENRNKNIVAVAQTGMGKTEASLFWIDEAKGFITLPIRVSLNALYERITNGMRYVDEEGQAIAGLLHSGSVDFLQTLNNDYETNELIYEQSRLLSKKLTFSTIDQILKFPFLFRGYEKYLATMAYSKIVLDEIQGYSPKILAVLLKALEMIHQIGGKFMIMTATLPTVFMETMERRGKIKVSDFVKEEFYNDLIRHRISIRKTMIDEDLEHIREAGRNKRVLIIANTVKEAKRIYGLFNNENVRLLHTKFIQKDRAILEEEIKKFAPNDKNREEQSGIWIATQLVEASLDIDFDLLFTEISTLDSLFQRLGRCYRGRSYEGTEPNVFIYTEAQGIGFVYNEDIVHNGLKLLESFNEQKLHEKTKMELVETLYKTENLSKKYLDEFYQALKVLDKLPLNDMKNTEAQRLLRDIDNYQVIPCSIYIENLELFKTFKQEKDSRQRKVLRMQIEKLTTSISRKHVQRYGIEAKEIDIPGLQYIHTLNCKYDFDKEKITGTGIVIP